jgi:serine/threonine protein kinase
MDPRKESIFKNNQTNQKLPIETNPSQKNDLDNKNNTDLIKSDNKENVMINKKTENSKNSLQTPNQKVTGEQLKNSTIDNSLRTKHTEQSFKELKEKCGIVREKDQPIGKGGFAEVYFGIKDNRRYAIKLIYIDPEMEENKKNKNLAWIRNEMIVTLNLRNKNCIRAWSMFDLTFHKALVLDVCINKDLSFLCSLFYRENLFQLNYKQMKRVEGSKIVSRISESFIRFFVSQMLVSLKYLRCMNFVHKDIKLENMFLMKNFQIKLGDFALSQMVPSSGDFKLSNAGTGVYMGPENFSQLTIPVKDAFKLDYYSLGVLIYKMYYNKFYIRPNEQKHIDSKELGNVLSTMHSKGIQYFKQVDGETVEISDQLCDLLIKLLHKDIDKRADLEDILEHKWINVNLNFLKILSDAHENEQHMKMILELQKLDFSKYYSEKSKKNFEPKISEIDNITSKINPIKAKAVKSIVKIARKGQKFKTKN